jgi:hypothetical protein
LGTLVYKFSVRDTNYPQFSIIETLNEIKNELKPEIKQEKSFDELKKEHLTIVHRREILRPKIHQLVLWVFEHYRYNIDDIGGIECEIMNMVWNGNPNNKKIKGVRTLEELKQNKELLSWITRQVVCKLADRELSEWNMTNLWINKRKEQN